MLQNIKVKNEISLITGSCGHLGRDFENSFEKYLRHEKIITVS